MDILLAPVAVAEQAPSAESVQLVSAATAEQEQRARSLGHLLRMQAAAVVVERQEEQAAQAAVELVETQEHLRWLAQQTQAAAQAALIKQLPSQAVQAS
jgi:hypothetical protein